MQKTKDMFHEEQEIIDTQEYTPKETGLVLSQKKLLDATKSDIKELAQLKVNDILDGHADVFDEMCYVVKGLEYFTLLDKNLRPYLYEKQLQKQSRFGITLEPAQLGTKYDYSVCQDPKLDELNTILAKAKKDVDDRQNFLKAINVSATLIDEVTGEINKVYAPIKTATSGYKLTLEK